MMRGARSPWRAPPRRTCAAGPTDRRAADHARVGGRDDARPARGPRCSSPGPSTAMTERMMTRYGKRQPRVDHALHHADRRLRRSSRSRRRWRSRGATARRDGREAHRDRHARAVDDAAPHVAAEVVGAEPVGGARRLHARATDRLVVAIRRDLLGEHRHHQQGHHDDARPAPPAACAARTARARQPTPAADARRCRAAVPAPPRAATCSVDRRARGFAPRSPGRSCAGAERRRALRLVADPRVEDRIERVDRQIDEHDQRRRRRG